MTVSRPGRFPIWSRSVYLQTLRTYRIGILGWGVGVGLLMATTMASVSTLTSTPQARAQLVSLAASFAWNADAISVDTIGGYATYKVGIFIFVITTWALLMASRVLRADEMRGSLDVLLSLPRSRVRVAVEKLAAIWTALILMALLIALLTWVGGARFGAAFGGGEALFFGLNLALLCAVFGGLALLLSQFTEESGTAAGWTASLVLVFVLLDMVHRVIPGTDWISRFSPVFYYNLNKPLVPGFSANPGAMLLLLGLALLLGAASVWLFAGRDVGGTVEMPAWLRPPARSTSAPRPAPLPEGRWSLRSVYARSVSVIAWPTFWWTLGIAGFAGWMVVVVKQTESRMSVIYSTSPFMKNLLARLGGGDVGFNAGFLSTIFLLLPLFLMAFSVTQVNRWSSDEEEGRLELLLSTPHSRLRILLARFAALASANVLICLATLGACTIGALATGLRLDPAHLAAATLGMIPLGLLVAAVGYLASGWLRTSVDTGLLSLLLLGWFVISFVGPELRWPDTTLRLSAFYYYGTPLIHGLQATGTVEILALTALALMAASLRFTSKDIGR